MGIVYGAPENLYGRHQRNSNAITYRRKDHHSKQIADFRLNNVKMPPVLDLKRLAYLMYAFEYRNKLQVEEKR